MLLKYSKEERLMQDCASEMLWVKNRNTTVGEYAEQKEPVDNCRTDIFLSSRTVHEKFHPRFYSSLLVLILHQR